MEKKRNKTAGLVGLIAVIILAAALIAFSDPIYSALSKVTFLVPAAVPEVPVEPQKPTYEITYGNYTPGVYTATIFGFESDITATVEVSQTEILSVKIDANGESTVGINAARDIKEAIISAQKADVDVVSGATYTSDAVIEAVMSALSQASVK